MQSIPIFKAKIYSKHPDSFVQPILVVSAKEEIQCSANFDYLGYRMRRIESESCQLGYHDPFSGTKSRGKAKNDDYFYFCVFMFSKKTCSFPIMTVKKSSFGLLLSLVFNKLLIHEEKFQPNDWFTIQRPADNNGTNTLSLSLSLFLSLLYIYAFLYPLHIFFFSYITLHRYDNFFLRYLCCRLIIFVQYWSLSAQPTTLLFVFLFLQLDLFIILRYSCLTERISLGHIFHNRTS